MVFCNSLKPKPACRDHIQSQGECLPGSTAWSLVESMEPQIIMMNVVECGKKYNRLRSGI